VITYFLEIYFISGKLESVDGEGYGVEAIEKTFSIH
jgi:hypothetical protein